MKTMLTMSLRLGSQVERRAVRRHGHERFESVEGGATFASLFPALIGRVLEFGTGRAVELAHEPEMIRAVEWLSVNGYFLRGGLQK